MARVTINICDLCDSRFEEELEFGIYLRHNGETEEGEICKDCFMSLSLKLKDEAFSKIPQAIPLMPWNPPSDKADGDSVPNIPPAIEPPRPHRIWNGPTSSVGTPTANLLDHEINKVPSKADQVVDKDANEGCKHKYDVIQTPLGDMHLACVKCEEKMTHESFD